MNAEPLLSALLGSVFGAWASSAHILALPDFYTYYWTIARSDNVTAVQSLQAAWASIDAILAPEPAKGSVQPKRDRKKLAAFLTLAGVPNMTEPADWASLARDPLDGVSSGQASEPCNDLLTGALVSVIAAPNRSMDRP